MDQVTISLAHFRAQVGDIQRKIHLIHCPRVLDRVAIHLVELGIAHGTQGEFETGIEDVLGAAGFGGHG